MIYGLAGSILKVHRLAENRRLANSGSSKSVKSAENVVDVTKATLVLLADGKGK